ncbi:unnamed protein product [Caenorhabditis angaria]|uniref:Uncharacterized protein n=1 Tax=Caenorhabditis angaria TaxID=860376 RepID=A0A9P1I4Y1_9PELO|nr:unnamed protein product [Caenorhabditis angaria]
MAQPLIALIASSNAQSIAVSRGFKSLSHLLYPFSSHETNVRDPVNNRTINHKVRLDIRDISNDGHLLTLSVLPYVLIQALKSANDSISAIESFKNVLIRWAEPSEHESFGAYLACFFVISTNDENAMGELSKMIQTQQTLYNSASTLMIPPYCCSPKWNTEHSKTLKHFILLHDSSKFENSTKRDEIYNQMCSIYGTDNCQVLQLNSSTEDSSKCWNEIDELNDILNRGLEEAMKQASSPTSPNSISSTSVSTISVPFSSSNVSKQAAESVFWKNSEKRFSSEDAENCRSIIKKFTTTCLSPFIEKEMRNLMEQVGNRRGLIGKGLAIGMKKWFGNGTSQTNLPLAAASYAWDSPEMLTRRLADLAYIFGNYQFAYQQYRTLKKDFEADQAMIAHSLAAEMCAVALHMAEPYMNPKNFPVRYLDESLSHLLNNSAKYSFIMRCAFNAKQILSDLSCYKEAATILSRLSSIEGDHLVAVSQLLAAISFENSGMHRKSSFYRVLAANRFSNAGIHNLAFDCYRLALPNFNEEHWGVLDEHLSMKLLIEGEKAGVMNSKMAMECVRRLIVVCSKLNESQQIDRLKKIIHVIDAYADPNEPIRIDLPKVDMNGIKVIYGERPMWNEIDDDENRHINSDEWIAIERAAHHTIFTSSTPFRGMQLVSDCYSDNQKIRETPIGERYRVIIDLSNPLNIPLNLRNVKLAVSSESNNEYDVGELAELQIQEKETKTIELYVFPRIAATNGSFKVTALVFKMVENGKMIDCQIPLECKGKRLNKTSKQQKAKMYAIDERLSANISQKPWPLLEFRIQKHPTKQVAFIDQAMRYQIEIENIGKENIVSTCLATNGYDRVCCGIIEDGKRVDVPLKLAVNNNQLATFSFGENILKIGEKRTIFIDIRASESSKILALLFGYRGENGVMREWRKVVDVERIPLLHVESNLLDEQTGTFSLQMSNRLSSSQAALSRVEVLRIRSSRNSSLEIISKRQKIEVESEQNDTIVLKMSRSSGANDLWLGEMIETPPNWPPPAAPLMNDIYNNQENVKKNVERKIGVLWKANIVNNDGQVCSIIGESFVDDPFDKEGAIHPDDDVIAHPSKLRISCDTIRDISHDFSSSKIAELPIKIHVQNIDSINRKASITLRYVSKIREAVEGIHLIPPENRQQLWVDRPVRRINLEGKERKEIVMKVRMANASVYDVVGANNLVIDAIFDGSDEKFTYTVPSILSVVKSI